MIRHTAKDLYDQCTVQRRYSLPCRAVLLISGEHTRKTFHCRRYRLRVASSLSSLSSLSSVSLPPSSPSSVGPSLHLVCDRLDRFDALRFPPPTAILTSGCATSSSFPTLLCFDLARPNLAILATLGTVAPRSHSHSRILSQIPRRSFANSSHPPISPT